MPKKGYSTSTKGRAPGAHDSKEALLDYQNYGRGRDAVALDEHDEESYAQAYGRASSTRGASDPVPGIRPAHPLPALKSSRIDYDRYLQRSKDKFRIFSAEERRRRNRAAAAAAGLGLFVVATIVIIFMLLNQ